MEEKNEHNILVEKVIRYFTDELGYPREYIVPNRTIHPKDKYDEIKDLAIYIFGEQKIYIELASNLSADSVDSKFRNRVSSLIADIPYYVIADGNNFYVFQINLNKALDKIPSFEELKTEINHVHESIFSFLEKKRRKNDMLKTYSHYYMT